MKTINIGLIWHSLHSDNLGIGALTLSQVALINEVAKAQNIRVTYKIWGSDGGKDYSSFVGDALTHMGYISLKEIVTLKSNLYSELKSCDLIFDIGEGDSFSDIYGLKRFYLHVITKFMVLSSGKKLILSPQTIGPYSKTVSRLFARYIMNKCAQVFARDDLSKAYLTKIGVKKNTEVAIDVAFALPFEKVVFESQKIKIGLNVSGLLYNGGYNQNNMFGLQFDYKELIHKLIEKFLKLGPEYEVHLVPHVPCESYPIDDDYRVCEALHDQYPSTIVSPNFPTPIAAKSYIAGLDFFTGARMHACIAAFSSGVPVIPMSYSRKFNGLFESLDYPFIADCLKETSEEVIGKVLDAINTRDSLSLRVAKGNLIAEGRLNIYKKYLSQLLV